MKNYKKPVVELNESMAEGVYANSGDSLDCYDISTHNWQDWGQNYWAAVNFQHNPDSSSVHVSPTQTITFYFNENVNVINGAVYGNDTNTPRADVVLSGNGTSVITVELSNMVDVYGSLGMVGLKIEKTSDTIKLESASIVCHQ